MLQGGDGECTVFRMFMNNHFHYVIFSRIQGGHRTRSLDAWILVLVPRKPRGWLSEASRLLWGMKNKARVGCWLLYEVTPISKVLWCVYKEWVRGASMCKHVHECACTCAMLAVGGTSQRMFTIVAGWRRNTLADRRWCALLKQEFQKASHCSAGCLAGVSADPTH
ncbi:hypothetical protein DUNSADRAFT_1709 [Dunaliella salina]|uniref:Encoded protein n=1 Tax=Dunaliella salina TaxID=3046 RepID=A0ABQ7FX78_DUNSA|nr:hypothetical protein DUNSADRAFT_1709 [Dunaliella salina]|eukprot:KAF5826943.1 hypothetical protein DUNSADRAFT_1709 [Dunaliella salina]